MHAAWTSACHDLAAVQAAWNKVLRQDLPRLNGVLKRNGLSVLVAPANLASRGCWQGVLAWVPALIKLAHNILLSAPIERTFSRAAVTDFL